MAKQNKFRKIPKIGDVNPQSDKEQNIKKEFSGLTAPVPPIELMPLVNRTSTRDIKPTYSKVLVKKIEDIGISPAN